MPPTTSDDLNPPGGERRTPDLGADIPDELANRLTDVLGEAALQRRLAWPEVAAVLDLVEREQ